MVARHARSYTRRAALVLAVCALLLPLVPWSPGVAARGAAGPILGLEPDRGRCDSRVAARGASFPPGATVILTSIRTRPPSGNGAEIARATVAADGTFEAALPFVGFECDAGTPEGTQYAVTAGVAGAGGRPAPGGPSARATFTVTSNPARCFAETGYCVRGRFLTYWETYGLDLGDPGVSARESLALFGYPLSEEFEQRLEDGQVYTVQYFERARFELHPENQPPYDLLLGQLGRRFHPADPPVAPEPSMRHFPETGHNVSNSEGFLSFWERNGGLAVFGYPLSEEFEERLEDGQVYRVQYFERARFEFHPENGPGNDVLLGHFGRRALAESGR